MAPEREDPTTPELTALLKSAARGGELDPAAHEQALRAFRTARDDGSLFDRAADARPQDDWRAAEPRPLAAGPFRMPSLKVLLAAAAAAVTLGGVAVAAGTGAIPSPFERGGGARQDAPTTQQPSAPPSRTATPEGQLPVPPRPDPSVGRSRHPGPGPDAEHADTRAQCKVYLRAVERHGTAPRSRSMERLEEKAGGAAEVPAYCARLTRDTAKPPGPEKGKSPDAAKKNERAPGQSLDNESQQDRQAPKKAKGKEE
ncbi:hypothetical protein F2B00_15510 [Streptomyces parvus]|uniref:hypothetical protein n=1 Tax=Streptomyces parvus TaxID=66428 RepID=UPI001239E111|nr:hypothetical protein [Streptomyces parvus]KAA6201339.1 hypothetical protein F2B00_15510 [Streptomyces parvus]